MTKSELIIALHKNQSYLSLHDVERAVHCLVNSMTNALAAGELVEVRGFGSFSLRHHEPRIGRNPRTGATVSVSQKHSVHFKAGLELSHRVRESAQNYRIVD